MNHRALALPLVSVLLSCAPAPAPAAAASGSPSLATVKAPERVPLKEQDPAPGPRDEVDEGAMAVFREAGVDGAFVMLDKPRNTRVVVNPDLASKGFLPASTFKIPNTLIGLETGVIPGPQFALKWDGTKRDVDDWNRDHDLASAMKYSVVWFYQEVARRIGPEPMRRYVDAFAYGNRDISGGQDRFWLDGALRITPREQVDFLRRLRARALPVKPQHAELVERLIVLDERPGVVLRGKTGLTYQGEKVVGWLVGFVDRGGDEYVYATLVLAPRGEGDMKRVMPIRKVIARKLLARRGALPPEMEREL